MKVHIPKKPDPAFCATIKHIPVPVPYLIEEELTLYRQVKQASKTRRVLDKKNRKCKLNESRQKYARLVSPNGSKRACIFLAQRHPPFGL